MFPACFFLFIKECVVARESHEPLLLWPGSLQASQCCHTVQWGRWGTCWRWSVLRGSGRSAPSNGPGSSYPHTPPSQGPGLEPAAGCQIAAAHTDQRTVLWGRRPCYLWQQYGCRHRSRIKLRAALSEMFLFYWWVEQRAQSRLPLLSLFFEEGAVEHRVPECAGWESEPRCGLQHFWSCSRPQRDPPAGDDQTT